MRIEKGDPETVSDKKPVFITKRPPEAFPSDVHEEERKGPWEEDQELQEKS